MRRGKDEMGMASTFEHAETGTEYRNKGDGWMHGFGGVLGSQRCLSLATGRSMSMYRWDEGNAKKGCKAHCTAID